LRTGIAILAVWLVLFLAAVVLRSYAAHRAWQVLGVFFYAASIIFGSGPVLVTLMYQYIVVPGWADSSAFLLGLAIINALPGELSHLIKHTCFMHTNDCLLRLTCCAHSGVLGRLLLFQIEFAMSACWPLLLSALANKAGTRC
jgi:Chromate transporter